MNRVEKKYDKPKKHGWLIIVFLIVVALGVLLGYNIQKRGGGLQGLIATVLGQNAEELENLNTITVLLLRS